MGGASVVILLITVAMVMKYFPLILILGIIGSIGATLFIAALVRRSRAEKQGRKPGKAMLITGIVLTLLPSASMVGFVLFYIIWVFIHGSAMLK